LEAAASVEVCEIRHHRQREHPRVHRSNAAQQEGAEPGKETQEGCSVTGKPQEGTSVPVRYLTAKDVAERYGLSIRWVYSCLTLPRRKVGRYLRFLESDLEIWEKRQAPSSRVYGFHIFESKPIIGKPRVRFTKKEIEQEKKGFELQFDCE
jgi:predicted DNA-binding transcriptional regulator AlpA